MIKRFCMLCVLCISCVSCAFNAKNAFKSVAKISFFVVDPETKENNQLAGTVWAINKDYLITAGHVCISFKMYQAFLDVETILLTFMDGNFNHTIKIINDMEIIDFDQINDICLMKQVNHGLIPLKLARNNVKFYDKVLTLGAPMGSFGYIDEGRVIDTNFTDPQEDAFNKMIISNASAPGLSGGPVLNEDGEVVGIVVMGSVPFDHISVITKLDDIKSFLTSNKIKF